AARRPARGRPRGRHGCARHEHHRDDDHPPASQHAELLLSIDGLTDEPVRGAPPSHYRGYAAVTPPSTLTTFPVDLADRGPAKNAIVSATSSGNTATPSFVRPL